MSFAKAADVPYTTIKSVMNGKSKSFSAKNAEKIADYAGVTVEWLLYGTEKAPDTEVSEAENGLINIYSQLNSANKAALDAAAVALLEQQNKS